MMDERSMKASHRSIELSNTLSLNKEEWILQTRAMSEVKKKVEVGDINRWVATTRVQC